MDAIEKAVATYRVALAERDAAEVKLGAAKADLVSALGLGTAADFSPSNEVAKAAVARPVKPPAKPAPKPKPPAATAPKAASKPAPASTSGIWTPDLAKKLLREIAGGASVLATIAAAGGSVPVDRVPRADGEGVMGVASVSPFLANMRARARSAFIELPIAAQGGGKVTLDQGLCAVLRAMGGAA